MKAENYMLENNLTKASTKRKKYTLKKVDSIFFEDAIKEFKSLLTSAIIEADERLRFLH